MFKKTLFVLALMGAALSASAAGRAFAADIQRKPSPPEASLPVSAASLFTDVTCSNARRRR
ncbi:hypothetical protein [Massilia scottii]|uniref:hypothetical protein n=1 Tax=Massilia scottii TaxID=3057166 RepID=UPI00279699DD|nr:hypothetical protein [Massilia sp. CCM 9029]MDQ1833784.1 hypothetical protein [Massilia sp. CCM 9029]